MKKCRLLAFLLAFCLVAGSAAAQGVQLPAGLKETFVAPVLLKGGAIYLPEVTAAQRVRALVGGAETETGDGLYLVQFAGPITAGDVRALRDVGAEVGDYLPDYAFLVRMNAKTASRVQTMSRVRAMGPYKPAYKLDASLQNQAGTARVRIFSFGGRSRGSWQALSEQGGRILGTGRDVVVAEVAANRLSSIAAAPDVVFIEPIRTNQLVNDVAGDIIGVTAVRRQGLDGSGQVVAVADTGLDTGDEKNLHTDFAGRIEKLFAWGRPGDASDTHGHGTHVAGSVVGTGAASGGKTKGTAPGARLVMQSIGDAQGGLSGIPDDISKLFDQAYQAGARIHSNSWGIPYSQGGATYDGQSRAVDQFTWEHRDMAILFAAGNDGDPDRDGKPNYGTVSSPGTAKNAITVGASESSRPDRGKSADDPTQVAIFSSRGYTADKRIKPDVVAPGSWILSTRSSKAPASSYWAVQDNAYGYMGGTSMATPLTAGAVAVLRQQLVQSLKAEPKGSLLKAVLAASATTISGSAQDQGWGRVNIPAAVALKAANLENESISLRTGQVQEYTYQVAPDAPLQVALAWADYPAAVSAGKALVNDLDLEVTGPNGQKLVGNNAVNGSSADRNNNVERVTIASPTAGTYTVRVRAHNVPQSEQSFSIAVMGNATRSGQQQPDPKPDPSPPAPGPDPNPPADQVPPEVRLTAPLDGARVAGVVNLTARAEDRGGISKVEFLVDNSTVGEASAAPYVVSWDSRTVTNGAHEITARAFDKSGNQAQNTVRIDVNNAAQPPPNGQIRTTQISGVLQQMGAVEQAYFESSRGTVRGDVTWQGWGELTVNVLDSGQRLVRTMVIPGAGSRAQVGEVKFAVPSAGLYTVQFRSGSGWGQYSARLEYPTPDAVLETVQQGQVALPGASIRSYLVTLNRSGALNAALQWTGMADLDLYLTDAQGRLIARGTSPILNPETISARVAKGTYVLYVVSDRGAAPYTLRLQYPGSR